MSTEYPSESVALCFEKVFREWYEQIRLCTLRQAQGTLRKTRDAL